MSAPGPRRDPRDVEALWHVLGFVGGYLLMRWLDDWEERRREAHHIDGTFRRLMRDVKAGEGTTEFLRKVKGGEAR